MNLFLRLTKTLSAERKQDKTLMNRIVTDPVLTKKPAAHDCDTQRLARVKVWSSISTCVSDQRQ